MAVNTLYDKCIANITRTLRNRVKLDGICFNHSNPFSDLPSCIINDLMEAAMLLSMKEPKVEDLYYFLTSGQLENFKLVKCSIQASDFLLILKCLTPYSRNLKSLIINVYLADPEYPDLEMYEAKALQSLLENSPRLEFLDSCVMFELKVLQNCPKLRILNLSYVMTRFLDGLLETDWQRLFYNYLEQFEFFNRDFPFKALIPIFSSCSELTYINTDISQVLEYMHREQLKQKVFDRQYNIQKCCLHRCLLDNTAANYAVAQIASLTCPNLKELDIIVKNHKTILVLCNFKNLTSLHIKWKPKRKGYFALGLFPLLSKIGVNLHYLKISNFSKVDLAAIATTCPNLEELCVFECSTIKSYGYSLVNMPYLKKFYLDVKNHKSKCTEETWVTLLSYCPNITSLYISHAESFDDSVLNELMTKCSFPHLTSVSMRDTNLSREGIMKLMTYLKSLTDIDISSEQVNSEMISGMLNEINFRGGFHNYDFSDDDIDDMFHDFGDDDSDDMFHDFGDYDEDDLIL